MSINSLQSANDKVTSVYHIIKGELVTGTDLEFGPPHSRFTTPKLDLDQLVWSRQQPGPAFSTPITEIMDVLEQTGQWLANDPVGLVAEALENSLKTGPLPRHIMEYSYENIGAPFNRKSMEFQIRSELGGVETVDSWRLVSDAPSGRPMRVRAFPPRLIHIVAGNAPGVSALTVVRGALTKGVHLLKLPSNDLFTAPAILRAMAAVAPGHPVTRSFTAAYWRGGDERVENALFRPQYFDKVIAWGGESSIRSVSKYIGPGFELVSFDPKTSISMIGREVFESDETLAAVVDKAAFDATLMNQQACASSRFQFIEGSTEQVDRYCAQLQQRLNVDRSMASALGPKVSDQMRDEIDGLRMLEPSYRVWGGYKGEGIVIRSEDPVDFHPDGKIVNVVQVNELHDAIRFVNVATQTVGIYPPERKADLRDLLASAGAQRIVNIGGSAGFEAGLPHDGFNPLQRFVRWINDEG